MISQWKSYKDIANWMNLYFSYDMKRMKEGIENRINIPVNSPKGNFEFKSGLYFDEARFAKETLNRIDPSYEAEVVFINREGHINHFVCSFKKDGKLYIMDYSTPSRSLREIHGPYNSFSYIWMD